MQFIKIALFVVLAFLGLAMANPSIAEPIRVKRQFNNNNNNGGGGGASFNNNNNGK